MASMPIFKPRPAARVTLSSTAKKESPERSRLQQTFYSVKRRYEDTHDNSFRIDARQHQDAKTPNILIR